MVVQENSPSKATNLGGCVCVCVCDAHTYTHTCTHTCIKYDDCKTGNHDNHKNLYKTKKHKRKATQQHLQQQPSTSQPTYCKASSLRSFGGKSPANKRGESGGMSNPNFFVRSNEMRGAALDEAK